MPPTPEHASHQPSLLQRKGCWLTVAACLPVVIGLLWVVEDQAGKHYLAKTKARLVAEGFELNPEKLLPSRPPDEENFCAVPSLVSLGKNDISNPTVAILRQLRWVPREFALPGKRTSFVSPSSPQPVDWKIAYDVLRAEFKKLKLPDLPDAPGREVEALSSVLETHLNHIIEELTAALERPKAVLIDTYRIKPHVGLSAGSFSTQDDIVTLSRLLRLQTHLDIERSQDEQACSGILIRLRLVEALDNQSAFFNASRACGVMEEANADIWLGLEKRFFNRGQIERLRDHFVSFSWIESMLKCYRHELAKTESNWQEIKMDRTTLLYNTAWVDNDLVASFLPNGLVDFNEAKWLNIQMDWLKHLEKSDAPDRFDSRKWKFAEKSCEGFYFHNLGIFYFSDYGRLAERYASVHASTQMATLACALELHYHDHERYPETLAELTPAYLKAVPVDFDQKPIRYRKDESNGRYQLWSIGLNGTDEGGLELPETPGKKPKAWREPVGDWVWRYPAAEKP